MRVLCFQCRDAADLFFGFQVVQPLKLRLKRLHISLVHSPLARPTRRPIQPSNAFAKIRLARDRIRKGGPEAESAIEG